MDTRKTLVAIAASTSLLAGSIAFTSTPAQAAQTVVPAIVMPAAAKYQFKNCTALNKVYPHGVGKSNAKDKTKGKRVTNFKHSTSLYNKIIGYRKGLDRDKDGIACERR